jgi:murein L,D-transpeptidase YcbB/YkuD
MLLRKLSTILLLLSVIACRQSRKAHTPLVRDSTHYTKEEYIDLVLDSNTLHRYLQEDTAVRNYGDLIRNFYQQRNYHYAWVSNEGMLTEQAGNFLNMIRNEEPLAPQDTHVVRPALQQLYDKIVQDSGRIASADASRLEMMLTGEFFAYGNKEWGGMTSDTAKGLEWFIPRKKLDMESLLDSLVQRPGNTFAEPVNRYYITLRDALKKLASLEKNGRWDSIHADKKIYKKGDSAAVITAVKDRLHAWGDLPLQDTSPVFTAALDTALRSFQERMGLAVNGSIQQPVLNALNVPLEKRIRQVLLNMERMRWVPVDPGNNYLLVNIPEFKLHVYENGRLSWSCNVVVGKPGASTVIFTKPLKHVVFSPYWNVPPGILANEVLPAVKRNPGYLARQNMEVVGASGKQIPAGSISWSKYSGSGFPYIIRQKPGRSNALGKVKFLFPNEYNIYLHDTPSRYLFGETKRSFSHGCIRVAEPKRLAEWILRNDPAWTPEKIDKAMNDSKEKFVQVKDTLPVFIGYFTAFVNSRGQLNFRDDVYGHDAKLAAQLFGKD